MDDQPTAAAPRRRRSGPTTGERLDAIDGRLERLEGRIDVLNGEKPHLRALAAAAPALVTLADHAPELIATAEERAEMATYRKVRDRRWGWVSRLDIARPWIYLTVAITGAALEHWLWH